LLRFPGTYGDVSAEALEGAQVRRAAMTLAKTPRLFTLLDRARRRPISWISGPPGAGKTSAVASYLHAHRLPGLWYQLEAGDGDVAGFFYYLRAAAGGDRRRPALPLLAAEYLAGLSTFTRRFFRELFAGFRKPFVVVFDNYHEVAASSQLHEVMRDALGEIPAHGHVALISRGDPPPAFARLRAGQAVARLGWPELRLTEHEARRLVRQVAPRVAGTDFHALYATTDGWAAGIVLMLEGQGGAAGAMARTAGHEAIFEYFAGEIFWQLTGQPSAGRVLAELSRQNYFTQRHDGGEPVYQYHPLFREFLLRRAEALLPAARRSEVLRTGAALLQRSGQVEAAVALLRDAREWEALGGLVEKEAAALVAQGRGRTVETWL
jgi:ATP/maltotriose-dependent transcriptional regulator MalT